MPAAPSLSLRVKGAVLIRPGWAAMGERPHLGFPSAFVSREINVSRLIGNCEVCWSCHFLPRRSTRQTFAARRLARIAYAHMYMYAHMDLTNVITSINVKFSFVIFTLIVFMSKHPFYLNRNACCQTSFVAFLCGIRSRCSFRRLPEVLFVWPPRRCKEIPFTCDY